MPCQHCLRLPGVCVQLASVCVCSSLTCTACLLYYLTCATPCSECLVGRQACVLSLALQHYPMPRRKHSSTLYALMRLLVFLLLPSYAASSKATTCTSSGVILSKP